MRRLCGGRRAGTLCEKMANLASDVKQHLTARGANLIGFADLDAVPSDKRGGLPRAVAFAVALAPHIVRGIAGGPTSEYYAEYERVNVLLGELSRSLAEMLRQRGFQAVASAATNEGIDPNTNSTVLPHKTIANLAGLGWIGKCALLVNPEFGSAVRLNRVLTDAPLPSATSIMASRCGDCRACVDACPGRAPTGKEWDPTKSRDEFFDAFACRLAAREMAQRRTGIADTFCGICIAACPWTKRYINSGAQQTFAAKRILPPA